MKPYFVTGIGTGVGKTVVSALLTEALKADYWKPIQTGALNDNDRSRVQQLISNSQTICFKEALLFKEPASPHLAAFLEQQSIDETQINLPFSKNNRLIIEGAGGLLVPLNERFYMIGLARRFDAEIILVCRNYLGCINHSLLSLEYLVKNKFRVKGLVLNGKFDAGVRAAIVNYTDVPLLAELDDLSEVSRETVLQEAKKINLDHFK